jgi:BASS family bile acid:Na+ symporter
MSADAHRDASRKEKTLRHISNACALAGSLIALLASRYVGMAMGALPWATASTLALWVASLVLGYSAFMSGRKAPTSSPFWMRLCGFVSASSSLLLTLCIVCGYLFHPSVEKSFVPHWNAYFLMASLFVMGLAINAGDWKRIVKAPRVVGICVSLRWICIPLAAWAVSYVMLVRLLPGIAGQNLAVGIIILGAAPTGTASNALTMIARGDLALSVSVTTINTLLAPFLLPLITLWLAGSMANVNVGAIFADLVRMVIIPVGVGSILGSVFIKQCNRIKPALGPAAVICLGLIMMGSMSRGTGTVLKQLYILPYLAGACFVYTVVTYLIGFFLPKLAGFDLKQRTAACFEVAVTNAALTMTIAARHFNPLAMVVSILYGKTMVIMGAIVFVPLFQKMGENETAEAPTAEGGLGDDRNS